MEILQLKYFQYTAKNENISHTAKKFMVPPSSVSASIKKLENELGVSLFDRTANSLKLNQSGKIFLSAIDLCEKQINKAKIDILNLSAVPHGEIKLLILTNRKQITESIVKFKAYYPDVAFSISHSDFENRDKYDIMISDRDSDLDIFEISEFVNEEIFLAVHKNSPIKGKSVNLKDLENEKFICMPKGRQIREYMDKCFKNAAINPEVVIECSDPYYIREYVKAGLGVTFFPSVSWSNQIDENIRLVKIGSGIFRTSYMHVNRSCSNIAKIFAANLSLSQKKLTSL